MKIPCPACQSNAFFKASMPIDAKNFAPIQALNIYQCNNCGHGFIHSTFSEEDISQLYKAFIHYTEAASHFVKVGTPSFIARIKMHLAWKLDKSIALLDIANARLSPSSRVLVAGAATEAFIQALSLKKISPFGVNIENPLNVVEQFLHTNTSQTIAQDGIILLNVLEHLPSPVDALKNMAKLLDKNGQLFLKVANYGALSAQQSGLAWEHLDAPRRMHYFTEKSLMHMLDQAGYTIEHVEFEGFCGMFSPAYIATEQRIFDHIAQVKERPFFGKRNSEFRSWLLLSKTVFASNALKYDAINMVARLK